MRSGAVVDFDTKEIFSLPLEDILYSLAREFRFHGQSDCSVLQHSIVTGMIATRMRFNPLVVKHAYVHDFAEAFLRDVPSMIKGPEYNALENEVYSKLMSFMGIPLLGGDDKDLLRQIDLHARVVEAYYAFEDIGIYEAVVEEVQIDPVMLMEAVMVWREVMDIEIFGENGEVSDVVVSVFKQLLGRFNL